eukprot:14682501-Alexandrium_andersonii.AAC.1
MAAGLEADGRGCADQLILFQQNASGQRRKQLPNAHVAKTAQAQATAIGLVLQPTGQQRQESQESRTQQPLA